MTYFLVVQERDRIYYLAGLQSAFSGRWLGFDFVVELEFS